MIPLPSRKSVIAACVVLVATLAECASAFPQSPDPSVILPPKSDGSTIQSALGPELDAGPDAALSLQDFFLQFKQGSEELTPESRALLAVLAGCTTPLLPDDARNSAASSGSLQQKFALRFEPTAADMSAESRALLAVLAGCTKRSGSYVVLLPSPDGSVGHVVVVNESGERHLTDAHRALALSGSAPSFKVSPEQFARDFGPTVAARPQLPEQFLLYFTLGTTELTVESRALLPSILQLARKRERVVVEGLSQSGTLDMSVIGHTDTLGRAGDNEVLGLQRAEVVANQLRQLGMENMTITIESHGERNLLVATPDGIGEPRNRRVEVTLR